MAGLLIAGATACAHPEESAGPSRASDPECIADLATPTRILTVDDADPTTTHFFLTSDAAVVQTGDADPEVVVLGAPGPLDDALRGGRVWAVTGLGFVLDTDPDNAAEAPLVVVDSRGETVSEGPTVGRIRSVDAVGDQFFVDDGTDVRAYGVLSGSRSAPRVAEDVDALPGVASSIVLTERGDAAGALDVASGRGLAFDDLTDLGATTPVRLAAVGTDRLLLSNRSKETRRTHFWTWTPDIGVQKSYVSADEEQYTGDGAGGICGDHLYLTENDQLKVVGAGLGGEILSRRPYVVQRDADVEVLAVPGGLLVSQYEEDTRAYDVLWFDR